MFTYPRPSRSLGNTGSSGRPDHLRLNMVGGSSSLVMMLWLIRLSKGKEPVIVDSKILNERSARRGDQVLGQDALVKIPW